MSVAANRGSVQSNVLWRLHREGHEAECVMACTPAGLQAQFLIDGQLLVAYQFSAHIEVLTWALEKSADLRARGWVRRDLQVQRRSTDSRFQQDTQPGGTSISSHSSSMSSVA